MAPLSSGELRVLLRRAWRHEEPKGIEERVRHGLDVIERRGLQVIPRGDERYPAILEQLHDPPPVLFAQGRLELLDRTVLGIVGTRRCTRDGREFTHEIASAVVMAGGVVVSGLALGIDGVAHRAALPETIAVLGAGIDVPQPPSHRELQEQIGEQGLLLSEFPPGAEALPFHFPQRNRIIAALSKVVLVVEAPARSGALITAEHAYELGVDVMAVPGPPRRHASVGSNALLRDGATLAMEPRDVLDALGLTPARRKADAAVPEQASLELAATPAGIQGDALALWHAAASGPCHIDELATRAGLDTAPSLNALLELEIMGLVRRHPGQRFERA